MLGAGTTFAGHQVEGVLGQGGMGNGYDAYFSFMTDRDRSRYLIKVNWPRHTADNILRDWWAVAPLGK